MKKGDERSYSLDEELISEENPNEKCSLNPYYYINVPVTYLLSSNKSAWNIFNKIPQKYVYAV